MNCNLSEYMLTIGIISVEYNYSIEDIKSNIIYFKECYNSNLPERDALNYLDSHINELK